MKYFWVFIILFSLNAYPQSPDLDFNILTTKKDEKRNELLEIKNSLLEIEDEVKLKQEKTTQLLTNEEKIKVAQEINQLEDERKEYLQQFIETSTGISLGERQVILDNSKRDIVKEVQDLLIPVLDTLKRASERPRKIEKLKNEIFNIDQELKPREEALKKIKDFILDPRYGQFSKELGQTSQILEKEVRELQIEIASKERQLRKELGEKKTFMDEATDLMASFMQNRGKNLFYFILTFIFAYWGMLWLRTRIFKLTIWKNEKYEFLIHPLKGLYGFIALIVALGASVLCLYLLHDWLLVTLIFVLIFGVIWSLKHILPRFFLEARLVLNLGPVRESERILWNGLPWKVQKIGFSTQIINPVLRGASFKISSRELVKLYSRPIVENELWFPTNEGDWVFLDKKTLAQVVSQTVEFIRLKTAINTDISIPTASFINLNIENLMSGFTIEKKYYLKLEDLKDSISDIVFQIKTDLFTKINDKVGFTTLAVSFHDVDIYGFCLYVGTSFSKEAAASRLILEREIALCFVEICHKYHYAFSQASNIVFNPKETI